MASEPSSARRLSALFWLAIVLAHAIVGAIWWWMMPAGFPIGHARFWLHRVVPIVLVAVAIACIAPRAKPVRPDLLAAVPSTYLAAAITGRVLFPITLRTLWLAPLVAGSVMLAIWLAEHRAHWKRASAFALCGALLGWFLAFAQSAPVASTHPSSVTFTPGASAPTPIAFDARSVRLEIHPVLTFISRSPDGCWTALASARDRLGPVDERSTLSTRVDDTTLHLEALVELPHAVYSHLNAYTAIGIGGYRRLYVAFSPAPDARIEALPSDYPAGRPAQFAYVAADRTFHVVRASDAEKGPFTDLATGRLAPEDPLAITLYDEQTPIVRITFEDFSAQASTELSPTAGWGVPQNAIEFSLHGTSASIFVTLAGTSVGRGFESVGHAAGVYRNRMRVERL